jgi:hypothetical protein
MAGQLPDGVANVDALMNDTSNLEAEVEQMV